MTIKKNPSKILLTQNMHIELNQAYKKREGTYLNYNPKRFHKTIGLVEHV